MSHHRHALLMLSLATFSTGCGDEASQAEAGETTPPPPATTAAPGTTTTGATDGGSTTGPPPAGCDCASGEYCAAPHQTGVIDPDDEALVYACRAECVPVEDPSVWCRADVPSCCGDLPCDDHGFCVDPNAVDTSSGSGSSGSGSGSSGSDTGTAGSSSSDGDSSSDSSSSGSSSSG